MNNKISYQRFKELDALRGLAAISVVLFHFTYGYDGWLGILSDEKFYFRHGNLGVHLFFIISGFVIFMTLDKTKKSASFIVSRFSRLFPAYWTAIILTVFITTILSVPFQQGIYSLKQVLFNFTMLQFWLRIKDVDNVYWTLAVELTFYFWIWIVFKFRKLNHAELLCLFWLLMSISFKAFAIPFGNYINIILILNHAPLFIGGITFYLLKNKGFKLFHHLLISVSLAAEIYILSSFTQSLFITFFYLVFYLFVYGKLKILSNKILLFFGSISYSLYLLHQNIGHAIIYNIRKVLDYQIIYIPITFIIVVFLAYLVNFYIEKPAMNFIRNYYKNHRIII